LRNLKTIYSLSIWAEEAYADDLEIQKENYALRNL
jgi:hypothetical protein